MHDADALQHPAAALGMAPEIKTFIISCPVTNAPYPIEEKESLAILDEETCLNLIAIMRWPQGFICSQCRDTRHYLIRSRNLRQCHSCRAQFSLTAGTVFESTRLPIVKWFLAIDAVVNRPKTTVNQFGAMLSLRYKTAWLLKYKIEHALKSDAERAMVLHIAAVMKSTVPR